MKNQVGKKIFLSYSSKSREETKALARDLKRMGHEVWFDQDLSGGQVWWDSICENIKHCGLFIFVLDNHSQNSNACESEWRYALALNAKILPIKIANNVSEKLLPTALIECQIFDYSKRDPDTFHELERQINDIPLPGDWPDPLPPQPRAPVSYLNDLAEKVGTVEKLTRKKQLELVETLEQMIREGKDEDGASALLQKLRRQGKLDFGVRKKVDDILGESDLEDLAFAVQPISALDTNDDVEIDSGHSEVGDEPSTIQASPGGVEEGRDEGEAAPEWAQTYSNKSKSKISNLPDSVPLGCLGVLKVIAGIISYFVTVALIGFGVVWLWGTLTGYVEPKTILWVAFFFGALLGNLVWFGVVAYIKNR
jgi:hypothetical protein